MASGKRNRKQAEPPSGGVDRRVWVAAAVVAALVLAVVVGILSTRDGGGDSGAGSTLPDAAEVTALFDGIPQQGIALGPAGAPVTLLEFVDLQCPFCREFEAEAMPTLVRDYVREGTLRIELRGLVFIGPDSERGLRAVLAAGPQERAYEMKALLFANQGVENSGWLDQELVEAAARSIPGVDVPRLVEDMDTSSVTDQIAEHATDAKLRGVRSTPTIFVGPTGGELQQVQLSSPSDVAAIEEAIAAARG